MPSTTFLNDSDLDRELPDKDMRLLLAEWRARSGKNYQIVPRRQEVGGWLRKRIVDRFDVYVFIGGVGPWQHVLAASGSAEVVKAHLYGLLQGFHDGRWLKKIKR